MGRGRRRFDRDLGHCLPSTAAAASWNLPIMPENIAHALTGWPTTAAAITTECIARCMPGRRKRPAPPHAGPGQHPRPAQFVFDRGQLGGPSGLLAFVVSASQGDGEAVQAAVLQQARDQLAACHCRPCSPYALCVIEKRATFACTPGLVRPPKSSRRGCWRSATTCRPYPPRWRAPCAAQRAVLARWWAKSGIAQHLGNRAFGAEAIPARTTGSAPAIGCCGGWDGARTIEGPYARHDATAAVTLRPASGVVGLRILADHQRQAQCLGCESSGRRHAPAHSGLGGSPRSTGTRKQNPIGGIATRRGS